MTGVQQKFLDEGKMDALVVTLNDSATSKTDVSVDGKNIQITSSEIFFSFEDGQVSIREDPEVNPSFNGPFKLVKMEDLSPKTNFSSYQKIMTDGNRVAQNFPTVAPKNIILEEFDFPWVFRPGGTGGPQGTGTKAYDSDADFEALKGQQLEKEKVYGTLKVTTSITRKW